MLILAEMSTEIMAVDTSNSNMELRYAVYIALLMSFLMNLLLIKFYTSRFEVNGQRYVLAGLMTQNQQGNTLYIPVYKEDR